MNKVYRLVVFDWEGTLHDTLGQVLSCVATEAKRLQLGEFDDELARHSVAFGLDKTIRKIFPTLNSGQHAHLLQAVQQSLMMHHSDVHLMKGAKDLVECLHQRGTFLAIATNKGHQSLQRALQVTGLDAYFAVTRTASQTLPKPAPQMLEEILDAVSVPIEEALMVGDSLSDIEMATNLGMDVVGMNLYYQLSEQFLSAGALKIFEDYQSLAEFLQC